MGSKHTEAFKAQFSNSYGINIKHKPDFTKCAECVHGDGVWPSWHQCTRKNGHGPEGAWCKMHDPVARKAKQAARDAKWQSDWDREKALNNAKAALVPALRAIADGHNDPRALATEVIATLDAASGLSGKGE